MPAIIASMNDVRQKVMRSYEALNHEACDKEGPVCIDQFWAALPYLTYPPECTSLKMSDLLSNVVCRHASLSNSRFQEFIRCLHSKAPNLEYVDLIDPRDWNLSLTAREVESLSRLARLTHLTILRVAIPVSGFLGIVSKCSSLRYINVDVIEADVEPCSSGSTEEFVYQRIDCRNLRNALLAWEMSKVMPQNEKKIAHLARFIRMDLAPRSAAELAFVEHLQRKVTHLRIIFDDLEDEHAIDPHLHFHKVECAELRCKQEPTAEALMFFLSRHGRNLKELNVKSIPRGKIEEVNRLCPFLSIKLNAIRTFDAK